MSLRFVESDLDIILLSYQSYWGCRMGSLARKFATFAAFALIIEPTAALAQWRIGDEREVDEGFYLKLIYSADGWRIWRTEMRDGVRCQAIKSAVGRPHPVPVGFQDLFHEGTPYLRISRGYQAPFGVDLRGRWGWGGKWRVPGERFWNEKLSWTDLKDDTKIEVHLETWEYDEIWVGLETERGTIDLTGFRRVLETLADCDDEISIPGEVQPSAPSPIKEFSSDAFYPSSALRQGLQGTVTYNLEISESGHVLSCSVIASSGHEVLDTETCRQAKIYGRFNPATDENGQPKAGSYQSKMTYRLNN